MKSTLHSTQVAFICARAFEFLIDLQAPKGVKERVKSPYSVLIILTYATYVSLTDLCSSLIMHSQHTLFTVARRMNMRTLIEQRAWI